MVFQDGGSFSQLYLKLISFESDSSTDRVSMLANTYISTRQGNRLLVRDDALTSKELRDNLYLRELMEDELTELRVCHQTATCFVHNSGCAGRVLQSWTCLSV